MRIVIFFPNYKMKKRRIGDNIETFSDNDNVSSNITDRDYENSNYYTSTTSEDLLNHVNIEYTYS